MEILENFIKSIIDVDNKAVKKITKLAKLKAYKKNDILVKVGDIQKNFFVLKSGLMRSYYSDNSGKIHIRNLFVKMRTSGDIGALIKQKPAKLTYDCLTDCEVYVINYYDFKELFEKDIQLCRLNNKLLENILLNFESKLFNLSVLNATERYLKLKKEIPEIENLLAQYNIASYLNITPVQLSRIRKEIYSK